MKPEIMYLLKANGVICTNDPDTFVTADLDLALELCEQQLLHASVELSNGVYPLISARSNDIHPVSMPNKSIPTKNPLELPRVLYAYLTPERKKLRDIQTLLDELASQFQIRELNQGK